MKMLFVILLCIVVLLGCNLFNSADQIESSIPGTYIRFSGHEFGKEYDTLVITMQNESAHEFKILRKWKYERMLDGKAVEPEYKVRTSTGIYHGADRVMQDTESGSLYSFDMKEKVLFNGEIKYKKV